ncbi:polyketide synthase [Teredinibacter turnerae]|uniref:polyketide synthase n=1 Tax=Teredinibacter turnerae TaxID=2426 RepID=UPI0030D31271
MQKATEKTDNRAVLAKALTELKRLQARVKELEAAQTREPIAIIGMSCRFPGGVTTPERLWEYLRGGNNAVQEVPSDRWDLDAFYDPIPGKPGKMYTRRGYFIDEIAGFDRDFFNVGPAEANAMDPQHRLLLETCWEALEYAGLSPTALRGSNTGMFLGAMNSDYAHYSVQDLNAISMYTAITNGNGIAAGRLAHNFGFQGPAIAVDTLCSSSLVSVHLAMRSLQNQECDLALAGGINLLVTPSMFVATCAASMLSTDGLCKTFDESADGYARGEGVGVIALKRLSDAQRDNDSILAVLRGGAVNQDGPSSALPVPNGKAQEKVIRAALKDAGVNPADIGYIEAHGTGTALGDPLEIEALNQVFGADRTAGQPLWLGSIKTNYGHTEGAAGIAGLLKVILALKHGEIPPTLIFRRPARKSPGIHCRLRW